ncbi:HDIG domain-containing protein [Clostridium tyrobutyricum]|uniref:HDIG domain-containing metalloprotein n=1 Tax=Clostridium tyrobutyricum TaxID=1519 RepID=UPI00031068B8|nr:HDIG domain-containing metalloprotein [Clostridium tyrobutyricum]MBR9648274.1 HDIG domain-containing protein [Clostridium tyrobutyricum]MBV4438521.1 HDIG domain-containing protein [Clostridium tyrobutyricum]MBV4441505.1 HDIG domain-containing protein [Clostridium tyrobutyricum]MBV4447840.1 HDIG domain-containing protein [Clostridium tyrobutyricum]MEA5008503.1 HDIG domain-containing protein [Clostridium tyrobutyricum]
MKLYRIKQFYWSLLSKIDKDDRKFVRYILNESELKLFYKLSISEQKHSIRVAYDVNKMCSMKNIDSTVLLKAALLHDIGKIYKRMSIIDKSILVLLDKITNGNIKNMCNFSKVNVYYNHAKLGSKLLNQINTNKNVIYLVANHDNSKVCANRELNILKECDNKN